MLKQLVNMPTKIKCVGTTYSDLKHPNFGKVAKAGSSYCIWQFGDMTINIINSFNDAYMRKEKKIICTGKDGKNYTIKANYQPENRRDIQVYDYTGEPILNSKNEASIKKAIQTKKEEWNEEVFKNIFSNLDTIQKLSNFDIAIESEILAKNCLRKQNGTKNS
jgi:hypothetical protein